MTQGDMFLKIETARHGAVRGEAQDKAHRDEIEVCGWSWGMQAQTPLTGAAPGARTALHELVIRKRVDSASTALMAVMRNNDLIKKAVLTVRKAGGTNPHEYLRVTVEKGRITALDVDTGDFAASGALAECLRLAYQRINVEYVPQGADGMGRGAMQFDAEIAA